MEKKLEVKNLQISFRTQGGILKAVRDISFDLYKGETLAIVGESGSGKSVTSKAIIGILAGNSIVEGGEILYDGQDLLKISEDDFHKIRGDRIAMIFQDPLSSLNPIMRVGQQLTEAMILKTKTSRRNARNQFNSRLKLLNQNIDEAMGNNNPKIIKRNKEVIETFDNFSIQATRLERVYNEEMAELIGAQLLIDNLLFLISKKQKVDLVKELREIYQSIQKSIHPYVLVADEEVVKCQQNIADLIKLGKKIPLEDAVSELEKLSKIVDVTALKKKPNYFTLGYYVMKNPTENLDNMS
ncbi:MAG: ATP-binding cassette domain-containing protein, partial [Bacilli bacterium]